MIVCNTNPYITSQTSYINLNHISLYYLLHVTSYFHVCLSMNSINVSVIDFIIHHRTQILIFAPAKAFCFMF